MHLITRIATLERRLPQAEVRCPRCGRATRSNGQKREYIIEFDDGSLPEPDEACPACGQRNVDRIEFDKGG